MASSPTANLLSLARPCAINLLQSIVVDTTVASTRALLLASEASSRSLAALKSFLDVMEDPCLFDCRVELKEAKRCYISLGLAA